jgi:organic radical activating enzyme
METDAHFDGAQALKFRPFSLGGRHFQGEPIARIERPYHSSAPALQRALPDVATSETLKLSEIFASLQGEGPSLGAPALFVRLALCNLRCAWCDTRYTWDFERYSFEREVREERVSEVARRIRAASERRVVITGGEPLLQQPALVSLLAELPADIQIEVETNGTLPPAAALLARVNQWNVSPKLAHSGDPEGRRIREDALSKLRDSGRAFLKFVVREAEDLREIEALLSRLSWPADRTYLMPEAATLQDHESRAPAVAALSERRGFGFSPRLHVVLWGGERGR